MSRVRAWMLNAVVATGLWIALVGASMNYSVIMANGGMPVRGTDERIGLHVPLTPQTRRKILADWIPFKQRLISPGDMVIYLGMTVSVLGIIRGVVRHANDRARSSKVD